MWTTSFPTFSNVARFLQLRASALVSSTAPLFFGYSTNRVKMWRYGAASVGILLGVLVDAQTSVSSNAVSEVLPPSLSSSAASSSEESLDPTVTYTTEGVTLIASLPATTPTDQIFMGWAPEEGTCKSSHPYILSTKRGIELMIMSYSYLRGMRYRPLVYKW